MLFNNTGIFIATSSTQEETGPKKMWHPLVARAAHSHHSEQTSKSFPGNYALTHVHNLNNSCFQQTKAALPGMPVHPKKSAWPCQQENTSHKGTKRVEHV